MTHLAVVSTDLVLDLLLHSMQHAVRKSLCWKTRFHSRTLGPTDASAHPHGIDATSPCLDVVGCVDIESDEQNFDHSPPSRRMKIKFSVNKLVFSNVLVHTASATAKDIASICQLWDLHVGSCSQALNSRHICKPLTHLFSDSDQSKSVCTPDLIIRAIFS